MTFRVNIIIEKDDDGYYAFCPDLKGCQSQGETFEEVTANIKEAIELYLETLSEEERKALLSSKMVYTSSLEVEVA